VRRWALLVAPIAAAALLAAGCGGGDDEGSPTETTTSVTTETTDDTTTETTDETETEETETDGTQAGGGDAEAGEQVFASAGCGSCHTLAAAGSSGTVGPNLDDASPSFDKVVETVTEGKGAMPSFADQLSEQEIRDVAAFVSTSSSS
jgi:mono/diheme cytochrome c family protein